MHRGTAEARAGYLAFLGRISPEKRPDRAISMARALGMPLKIAAKVDRVDEAYFETEIEPWSRVAALNSSVRSTTIKRRNSSASAGAAVPNRLARAVRALHDRGDGLWNAGDGFSLRLGFRDRRGRHYRRYRRNHGRSDRGAAARHCARSKKGASAFELRFSATRMAKDYVGINRSLLATSAKREQQEIELAPNAKDLNILRPLVA